MLKTIILIATCSILRATCGVIHDDEVAETNFEHNLDHKHATSHQQVKIHHFHAVPVYVKKEDQKLLQHPVEVSALKSQLKIVHPEAQHSNGHGLTLENHSELEEHKLYHGHGGGFDSGYAGSESIDYNPEQTYRQQIEVNEDEE